MAENKTEAVIAAYNERIWSSIHMADAIRLAKEGVEQLETGNGWGKLALELARQRLTAAVQMIEQMESWKVEEGS